jgi:hypothetical protein
LEDFVINSTGKRIAKFGSLFSSALIFLAMTAGSIAAQASGSTKLDAYALRGPQDATAKLYLSVSAPSGAVPQQFDRVRVLLTGSEGQPQNALTYTQVAAPNGQAAIDIGDVPLLAPVSVQVTLGQGDAGRALNATAAVTEFAVSAQNVVVPDFEGFGAQMNMHLYTALNDPTKGTGNVPPQDLPNLEEKVKELKPGLVRIFLSPANYDPANQNRMTSFYQTVGLAQQAGAKVNITWWFIDRAPKDDPVVQQTLIRQDMQEFAGTLADLVINHKLAAVQQITIQNEVNTSWIKPPLYEQCYRLLDQYLRADGIRDHIKFVGGDLVINNQLTWFQYMAANMGDVLDGWSVHIYWNYWDTAYMQSRLSGILSIYNSIPVAQRKPLSITEYGVRGVKAINGVSIMVPDPYRNGKLVLTDPGMYIDSAGNQTPISETNIAAFEQAWFNILGAEDGFSGFSKWDFYRAQYDFGFQDHSLIGYLFNPATGQDRWPLRPTYYMEWLMANTTGQHWQVLGLQGTSGAKLVAPFRGPSGDQTIFALSSDQADATFTIGNVARGTEFNVLVWNADGAGDVSNLGTVNSGGSGTVSVHAPAGSMVALTTLPSTGWRLCRSSSGPCTTFEPHQPTQ